MTRHQTNLDELGEGVDPDNPKGAKVVIVPAKDGDGAPVVKKINPDEAGT